MLSKANKNRFDAEGLQDVDIDANSHPKWNKWIKSLTGEQKGALDVYRGGAIWTQTRRFRWSAEDPVRCCYCDAKEPSARHLWAHCPRYAQRRAEANVTYGLEEEFWTTQPKCTSKTGWITLSADANPTRRALKQIASCVLGIAMILDTEERKAKSTPM